MGIVYVEVGAEKMNFIRPRLAFESETTHKKSTGHGRCLMKYGN
jgi:hypothetical protein